MLIDYITIYRDIADCRRLFERLISVFFLYRGGAQPLHTYVRSLCFLPTNDFRSGILLRHFGHSFSSLMMVDNPIETGIGSNVLQGNPLFK